MASSVILPTATTMPEYNFPIFRGDTVMVAFTCAPFAEPAAGDVIRGQIRDVNDNLVLDLSSDNGTEITWVPFTDPVTAATGISVVATLTRLQTLRLSGTTYKYSISAIYNSHDPVSQITMLSGTTTVSYNPLHGEQKMPPMILSGSTLSGCGLALSALADVTPGKLSDTWSDGANVFTRVSATAGALSIPFTDLEGGTLHLSSMVSGVTSIRFPSLTGVKAVLGANALPSTVTALELTGSGTNTITSLALGTPSAALQSIAVTGFSTLTTLTSAATLNVAAVDFSHNALNVTSVNALLVALAAGTTSGGTLDLHGGTNAAPTGAGLTAVSTLTTRSWTVNVNS